MKQEEWEDFLKRQKQQLKSHKTELSAVLSSNDDSVDVDDGESESGKVAEDDDDDEEVTVKPTASSKSKKKKGAKSSLLITSADYTEFESSAISMAAADLLQAQKKPKIK
jgi:hypothetical protein